MSKIYHNVVMKDISSLKKLGIFKASSAMKHGFTNTDIARMVRSGVLVKLARGVYHHIEYQVDPDHIEFVVACTRFGPDAVIGGVSALFYYNLVESIPNQVWTLVPPERKTTDQNYRFLRTATSLRIGVLKERDYKIVTLERALVDAFYYSTKIGLDIAMRATAIALKRKETTLPKIVGIAKKLKLEAVINKHWESLSGLQEAV